MRCAGFFYLHSCAGGTEENGGWEISNFLGFLGIVGVG